MSGDYVRASPLSYVLLRIASGYTPLNTFKRFDIELGRITNSPRGPAKASTSVSVRGDKTCNWNTMRCGLRWELIALCESFCRCAFVTIPHHEVATLQTPLGTISVSASCRSSPVQNPAFVAPFMPGILILCSVPGDTVYLWHALCRETEARTLVFPKWYLLFSPCCR